MSEKIQHTAARLRDKMLQRYGDGFHHKHNKFHHLYRQHFRTYPAKPHEQPTTEDSPELVYAFKLRKIRKRLDKGRIH